MLNKPLSTRNYTSNFDDHQVPDKLQNIDFSPKHLKCQPAMAIETPDYHNEYGDNLRQHIP